MNAETTKALIEAIATIIGIILTTYIIPVLKQRIDGDKLKTIREYTEIAVRCAEQIYTPEQWQDKKKYVYNYILEKAGEIGIAMEPPDIDLLVEGIVNQVKHGGE